jgi:hypothetical protein
MRTTIIPPVPLLEKYSKYNGGYHLILASLARRYPSYGLFYRSLSDRGEFIILDNDAYEEGVGTSFETLDILNAMIRPAEIVLPDVLTSGSETVRKSEMTYQAFMYGHKAFPKFMGVPHGSSVVEWMECAEALIRIGVDSIGMARMYGEEPLHGFVPYLQGLNSLVLKKLFSGICPMPVHLLGWSDRLEALREVARMPYMEGVYLRGVDSSKPLTYAQQGLWISKEVPYKGRPEGYFGMDAQCFNEDIAVDNIRIFKSYAYDL